MAKGASLDEAFASRIIDSIHRLHLHVPIALIRKLGGVMDLRTSRAGP